MVTSRVDIYGLKFAFKTKTKENCWGFFIWKKLLESKMRPDKKKKQHHDSRKRAEKSREGAPGGKPESELESNPQQEETEDNKLSATNEEPSKEVKSKAKEPKVIEEKPLKNISSNWTKYELPSEDEDEEDGTMTGLNFNFALENAGKYVEPVNLYMYYIKDYNVKYRL